MVAARSVTYMPFSAFSSFKIEQPVYINIIRDPINRFLSNYFFRRFGDFRGEQFHLLRTPNMKDEERYLVRRTSDSTMKKTRNDIVCLNNCWKKSVGILSIMAPLHPSADAQNTGL